MLSDPLTPGSTTSGESPFSRPQPSLFRQWLGTLLAVALPAVCPLCGQEISDSLAGGLCRDCWSALTPWTGPLCSRCGLPLAGNPNVPLVLCAECRRGEPQFDFARSYAVYGGSIRAAVLELKFHGRERLGRRLGELLLAPGQALAAMASSSWPALVLPVPLHRSRERQRGYNQAELLARGLARAIQKTGGSADVVAHALTRERATAPQSGLSLQARHENVRGVFAVTDPGRIGRRDVMLVDDVMTSGATTSACASALKRAGAERVFVITLARATPQFPDLTPPRRVASGEWLAAIH